MATDFTAARHGFHFPNSFTNTVATIPGFGPINTFGLCGGMSFAALDYYWSSTPVPTHSPGDFGAGATCPPQGTRLYQYIFDRQLNTFDPIENPSIVKFATQALPIGRTAYEVTVQDEWPLVTAEIDAGRPCPIGLIANTALTDCHQVVAIGYSTSPRRIDIYDCNHPDVAVSLDLDDIGQQVLESTGETWLGLFLEQYTQAAVQYVDVVMSAPITTNPSPPGLAMPAEVGFEVSNVGEFTAHLASLDMLTRGPLGEDLDGMFVSDGVSSTLAPFATRNYNALTDSFGTTSGDYELVAYFKTLQAEWIPMHSESAASPGSTVVTVF